jgi:hypothetical protein
MPEEKITNITQKINSGSEDNNGQQVGKVNSEVIRGNFLQATKTRIKNQYSLVYLRNCQMECKSNT